MSHLVTFGETMALLSAPAVGPLRHATALELSVAGTESNVAIGFRRLGHPATWMGRVGDDEFGRLVLTRLRGEGVDVDGATVDPEAPTGLMIKERRTVDATRVAYYRRNSAASRLRPDLLDEDAIRAATVLHVTGVTPALSPSARAAVHASVEIARDAGVSVSFDPNFRAALWSAEEASREFRILARKVDLVFATEAEAAMIAGDRGDPAELARALADAGPVTAVVKRGARGAVAAVDGDVHRVDAVPVAVVDAVGAGDGFVAGYLTGFVEGQPAMACLDLAVTVGAFAVTVSGDWEGLPRRDELPLILPREEGVDR